MSGRATAGTPARVDAAWASLNRREHWRMHRGFSSASFSTSEADAHPTLNRYTDVLPYDRTLVRFPDCTDYVHASNIVDPSGRHWIASQGPLPDTCEAFWRIVSDLPEDQAPRVIVMLTGLVENRRTKCERYFSETTDAPLRFGAVTVTLRDVEVAADWRRSTLSVTREGSDRSVEVQHLAYTSWPDHGVPSSPSALLKLLAEMHRLNGGRESKRPVLIHCSAGIGRTGTAIACSALEELLPNLDLPTSRPDPAGMPPLSRADLEDPVVRTVDWLRDQRTMLVQTEDQLAFVYKALDYARRQ